jgi:hypothetical protein
LISPAAGVGGARRFHPDKGEPMKNAILPLCAALMLAAGAVHAADDPLVGTWKADVKPGGDIKAQTVTVTAAPGGYSFETIIQPAQGDKIETVQPVVPDGKPHTANSAYGPITATCHRTDPRTLRCATVFMGSNSTSTFALSADGQTLTETDVNQVETVNASSETHVAEDNGKLSQDSTSGTSSTKMGTETETTVFHKQ